MKIIKKNIKIPNKIRTNNINFINVQNIILES